MRMYSIVEAKINLEEHAVWGRFPGFVFPVLLYLLCYLKQVHLCPSFSSVSWRQVIALRRLNSLILKEFLDLCQAYRAQKGLILCFGIWEMLPLSVSSSFGVKVELPCLFLVTEPVTFRSHHFSGHWTQCLTDGSVFHLGFTFWAHVNSVQ